MAYAPQRMLRIFLICLPQWTTRSWPLKLSSTNINGTYDTEVAFYEVVGGGHNEPRMSERYSNVFKAIVKEQNGAIEMATKVWNFFKTKIKNNEA